MHGQDAGIREHRHDFIEPTNALLEHLLLGSVILQNGKTHHAHHLGTQTLHAGNGSLDLSHAIVVGLIDRFGPIGNGRAEAVDMDARILELATSHIEGGIVQVMDIDAVNIARLDVGPSQRLGRCNLAVYVPCRLIRKTSQVHQQALLIHPHMISTRATADSDALKPETNGMQPISSGIVATPLGQQKRNPRKSVVQRLNPRDSSAGRGCRTNR